MSKKIKHITMKKLQIYKTHFKNSSVIDLYIINGKQ